MEANFVITISYKPAKNLSYSLRYIIVIKATLKLNTFKYRDMHISSFSYPLKNFPKEM